LLCGKGWPCSRGSASTTPPAPRAWVGPSPCSFCCWGSCSAFGGRDRQPTLILYHTGPEKRRQALFTTGQARRPVPLTHPSPPDGLRFRATSSCVVGRIYWIRRLCKSSCPA